MTPGDGDAPALEDGDELAQRGRAGDREIDEISTFDKATRDDFQGWMKELAKAIKQGAART